MPQERIERGKRVRACTICGRTFKRTEHCIRHERAHFRERPFSCRFCDKSYGRKDLLVRHERTLHADDWANAQLNASPDASSRPGRRRQSRNSWSNVHPLQQPLLQLEPQYKEELQAGIRINDETVIQYDSFLPSPRVSSSSEISEPEPAVGASDVGMEGEFPVDPSLSYAVHMIGGGVHESAPHQFIPLYPMEQRHVVYDPHIQTHSLEQFSAYQGFPIDPNLTIDVPQMDDTPMPPDEMASRTENMNMFALFPALKFDSHTLTGYLDRSFNAESTMQLLNDVSLDVVPSSIQSPPEPRRRGRPPRIVKVQSSAQPRKAFTEEARLSLIADLDESYHCKAEESQIPPSQVIQNFLSHFFQSFNSNLPIFHLPTFNVSTTPCPLFLAMCSIGALYGSEKDAATRLRELAKQALSNVEFKLKRPLWEAQCRLLLIIQAAFAGDCTAAKWALENVGFLHQEFSSRREVLAASEDVQAESWTVWIEEESSKRLLLAMFIISSLLTLTYNVPPCISTNEDMKIVMPAEEHAWMAADEGVWKKAMAAKAPPKVDLHLALTRVLFGKGFDADTESQWPAFAITALMHGVNVHMWHITQSTQSFMNFSADAKAEEQMKALCTSQTEEALTRCYMIFARRHSQNEETYWDDIEGPLLFNAMAVLRSCYVRAFTSSGSFNRSLLFSNDEEAVLGAATEYMKNDQVRTPFLTDAVAQVFDGLLTPLMMVHKTMETEANLVRSVEHAVATWDAALFYIKWVHTMEKQQAFSQPDHEEKQNLDSLMDLLRKGDKIQTDNHSLAATVARLFADFIDSSWTWEVTWRMGKVLRDLAIMYEY